MIPPGRELLPSAPSRRDGRSPGSRRHVVSLLTFGLLVSTAIVASVPAVAGQGTGQAETTPDETDASTGAGAWGGDAAALSVRPGDRSASIRTANGTTTETATRTPETPTDDSRDESNATGTPSSTATPSPTETPSPSPTLTDTESSETATPAGDPAFAVSNLTAPDVVRADGEVTVSAAVTNRGDGVGTERVNYSLAGRTAASERVTLAPGESTRVTFHAPVRSVDPATYVHGVRNESGDGAARRLRVTPAVDLSVPAFDAPTAISRGESYVVLASVENPADASVTRRVSYVFDGATVATKPVTVAGGQRERVAFQVGIADLEPVAGPIENGSTHTHAVVAAGRTREGGEVLVRRGPGADASALAVERFRTADDLRPGETNRVNLTVRNVGAAVFEGQIAYRIDESAVDVEWVRVPVGERRTVSFAVAHGDLERRSVALSAGQTTHDVRVGDESLASRPITIHGPFETPTATPAGTPTFTESSGGGSPSADGTRTATTPDSDCLRGLFTRCGGAAFDETSLTLVGIFTSVLGIVYEMVSG